MSVHHPSSIRIENRTVQRMSHLADQSLGAAARQPRIGIKRDDVPVVRRYGRRLVVDRHERRIGCAAQEAIELVQLSPLAFPTHPALLCFVPDASAMQQEKAITLRRRAAEAIQPGYSRYGRIEKIGIIRRTLG